MINWGKKLGILVNFKRRLQDESTESKITQFVLVFAEKPMSKNIEREINYEERK